MLKEKGRDGIVYRRCHCLFKKLKKIIYEWVCITNLGKDSQKCDGIDCW